MAHGGELKEKSHASIGSFIAERFCRFIIFNSMMTFEQMKDKGMWVEPETNIKNTVLNCKQRVSKKHVAILEDVAKQSVRGINGRRNYNEPEFLAAVISILEIDGNYKVEKNNDGKHVVTKRYKHISERKGWNLISQFINFFKGFIIGYIAIWLIDKL